jgi:hemerythrin superfamily protein
MDNNEIMKMIWNFKKKGKIIDNIHSFSGNIVDSVIKKSMSKLSTDNVSSIFIAFKNFENKMKDEEFQYREEPQCKFIGNEIDFDYKEN